MSCVLQEKDCGSNMRIAYYSPKRIKDSKKSIRILGLPTSEVHNFF